MNIKKLNWWMGGSAEPEPSLYTLLSANLVYYNDAAYLLNMLQESALDGTDQVGRTAVTSTNDNIGTIYDISDNSLKTFAAANNRRPTLVSKVGSDAWFNYSAAGTNQYSVIINSQKIFNYLTAANPTGTIVFKIDFSTLTDGTQYFILDNIAGSAGGGRSGVSIRRSTGNKLVVQMAQGGSSKVNYTSTFTCNAAAGIVHITISFEGTAGGLKVYFNNGTAETSTISAGSDNLVNFADMQVGMAAGSNTNGLNAAIQYYFFTNNVLSTGDRGTAFAWNPTRNTTKEIVRTFRKIDTNDNTLMSQLANGTSVADTNRIRRIKTKNRAIGSGTGDELIRDWMAPLFYIDLSGSSTNGHACTITIDGVVLTATFATSLFQTSVNFRTNGTNSTNLITLGLFVVEQPNTANAVLGRINFYQIVPGSAEPASVVINTTVGTLTATKFDTKRAIWDSDGYNGTKGALLFTESDYTNYIMADGGVESGGKWTKGFDVKYFPADTADVGHFSVGNQSGTDRALLTGPNYSGNNLVSGATGNGYFVWHGSSDVFGDGAILPLVWNRVIVQRNGVNVTVYINGVLIESAVIASNMQIKMLYRGCAQVGDQTTASKNQWEGWMANTVEVTGLATVAQMNALMD